MVPPYVADEHGPARLSYQQAEAMSRPEARRCTSSGTPIPDRSPRTWLRLLNDFRIEPRARREDREIDLCSRVLVLNNQETASGDTESVTFFVGHLVVLGRGAAEIDLDSHDQQSFERGRVFDTCHGTGSRATRPRW